MYIPIIAIQVVNILQQAKKNFSEINSAFKA